MSLVAFQVFSSSRIRGILYTLLHAASVPLIYAIIKELTHDITSSQAVFFYKFTLLIIIMPWVLKDGLPALKTKKILLHMLRAIISTASSICIMLSLKAVDLIDVTAMTYLENIFIVIIGILFFNEPPSWTKVIALAISFLGIIIVLYPVVITTTDTLLVKFIIPERFNRYHALLLIAIIMQLINWIIVKIMGKTESNRQQLFYLTALSSVSAFFSAFIQWKTAITIGGDISIPYGLELSSFPKLELHHLYLILGVSLCYLAHTVGIFKAFQCSDMSVIAPFDYSRLIFSGIYGYIFFKETPLYTSYIGYFFIVLAGLILIRSEVRRSNYKH